MNNRLYLTLVMSIVILAGVFASGCADSGDAVKDETGVNQDNVSSPNDENTGQVEASGNSFVNSVGMEFVKIPAGEFIMGAPEDETYSDRNERPTHEVTISNAYYMGVCEVTQQQWEEIMGSNPSGFIGDDLPVERVSWTEANKFIALLNEKEATDTYRLPTEAEWEYAARADTSSAYSFGDDPEMLADYGWYKDNSEDMTHAVGTKKANFWGLYDVHGNVAEWVMDEYHSNYQNAPTDGSEWADGVSRRVIRGGSWNNADVNCRSAYREDLGEGSHADNVGFRIVKEI